MGTAELRAMIELVDRHWWYRGRRRVVRAALDRLDIPANAAILDAGTGSGQTLDELSHYGQVTGIDTSREAVEAARSRGHDHVFSSRVEDMPFADSSFDLITSLDVIEHTPNDVAALKELRRVARPGARLLVTVPAYQWLWSRHDDANLHYRRYRRTTLRDSTDAAGWTIARTTYFNSMLLAPAAAVRLAQRVLPAPRHARSDLRLTPRALDAALALPMSAEALLLRLGLKLPAGLSLLAVLVNEPAEGVVELDWPEPAATRTAARPA